MENSISSGPMDIAIIGGGIGGLSLLLGILEHGNSSIVRPHLYESAPAFSEIGAGVGFGPNSVQAMSIVSPKLSDAYKGIASDTETIEVNGVRKAVWNEMVMGMDGKSSRNPLRAGDVLTKVIFENHIMPKKTIHRARFLDAMINLLPQGSVTNHVSFKKRCTDIATDQPDGKVTVSFADGTSTNVDAVVGCDGVKSRVRHILLSAQGDMEAVNPRFSGKYAYRGLIPMEKAVAALGPIARRSHMQWGYDGHLVLFPVDRGTTMNVVAFHTTENGKWSSPDWVVPATVEQAVDDFAGWSEAIRNLLKQLEKPDKWAIFEHPPARSYTDGEGKIVLLGDCAHASTPHQGAGAGMAIEDAAVLCMLLSKVKTKDDLKSAFHIYDQLRRPRSQKLVTTSREAGCLYEFQDPECGDDVEKCKKNVDNRMKWLWDFNMAKECQRALEMLESSQ